MKSVVSSLEKFTFPRYKFTKMNHHLSMSVLDEKHPEIARQIRESTLCDKTIWCDPGCYVCADSIYDAKIKVSQVFCRLFDAYEYEVRIRHSKQNKLSWNIDHFGFQIQFKLQIFLLHNGQRLRPIVSIERRNGDIILFRRLYQRIQPRTVSELKSEFPPLPESHSPTTQQLHWEDVYAMLENDEMRQLLHAIVIQPELIDTPRLDEFTQFRETVNQYRSQQPKSLFMLDCICFDLGLLYKRYFGEQKEM